MIVMTIEHTDFQATLNMMSDRQSVEEMLKEIGYPIGVDFQTNITHYLVSTSDGSGRSLSLNSKNFPYFYFQLEQ